MRGRKPKPTVLKDLHGSDQPRNKLEPVPVGALNDDPNDCPDYFDDDQQAAWGFALAHSPPGMLKRIDSGILEVWVVAHCLHRQATRGLMCSDLLIRDPRSNALTTSPFIRIIARQAQIMLKAAEQLGFTPVARPRILAGGLAAENLTPATSPNARDAAAQPLKDYLAAAPRTTPLH